MVGHHAHALRLFVLHLLSLCLCSCGPAKEVPLEPREETVAQALALAPCANMLTNPGFEAQASGWTVFNAATTVTGVAHSGARAASVDATRVFNQRVGVTGGQSYLLSQWLRSASGEPRGRVQVNWIDASNQFLSVSWLKPKLTTTYREFHLVATAPASAVTAEIYATADTGQGTIYVDDISFSLTNHLRHQAYWYAESTADHYIPAVAGYTNLVYLNPNSFGPGWNFDTGLPGFVTAVQAARDNGLQVIADLSGAVYSPQGGLASQAVRDPRLQAYATAMSGLEYTLFANYVDEPDQFDPVQVGNAVTAIKTFQPATPVMVTYVFNPNQGPPPANDIVVPSNIDIVAVDPYPEFSGRFAFDQVVAERISRAHASAGTRPLFLIGNSTDHSYPVNRDEPWWFYEAAVNDPGIIGLGWFSYANFHDPINNWNGAASYPELREAHQHIATNIYCQNLLNDPGFEQVSSGTWTQYGNGGSSTASNILTNGRFLNGSSGWFQFGSPLILNFGLYAYAIVDLTNLYLQQVPINGGATYQLAQSSAGSLGAGRGRLQINWLDVSHTLIRPDVIRPVLNGAYATYAMTAVAPSAARYAEVYATSDATGATQVMEWISLLANPDKVHMGANSASADATNGYWQHVPVDPGKSYRLAQWARGVIGTETGRVQVNWLNASGAFISTSLTPVPNVGPAWIHQKSDVTSPAGAAIAEIYASSHATGNRVLLDDFSFTRL